MAAATMRAALFRAREQLVVGQVPIPEPARGEVRIRVLACGVCGSDLHLHHVGPMAPDVTPGHEMAGEVDALGEGVESVAIGERVVVEPLSSCGSCPACRAGRDSICRELKLYGIQCSGGFAEYIAVPARRIFRVPDDLGPRLAALIEPMAVAVHGLRRGGLEREQRVLVIGAGSIGLLATLAARALGAGEVWLTARYPHQAELGTALGASRVLTESDATSWALAELGRDAPIDLVVETVGGQADTLNQAAAAVRPGGAVSVLGMFVGPVSLETTALLMKEVTLAWSLCYARPTEQTDFAAAVELVDRHRSDLANLLTHEVPLDEIDRAYTLAADKKAGAVKVTVLP